MDCELPGIDDTDTGPAPQRGIRGHLSAPSAKGLVVVGSSLLLATLFASGGVRAGTTEDLEARWRREYPRAAAGLERIAQSFFAKGSFTFRTVHGKTLTTNELTVASSGDRKLFVRERRTIESPKIPKRPETSRVLCRTPDYVFTLTKESPADPYVLADYSAKFENEDADFNFDYNMYARCSTVYLAGTLLERMQNPSFVVKAAESLHEGGNEVVRIDYTYDETERSESGAVYLYPKRSWAIGKVDVIDQSKILNPRTKEPNPAYHYQSEVVYQGVGDGVFFPKRMEFFGRTPRPDAYEHALLELTQITVGKVPPGIFQLTGYGLPDIPLKAVRESSAFSFRNPLFWGALITAILSFALLRVMRAKAGESSRSVVP